MAFSNGLAKNGTPATSLDVSAEVSFEKGDAGFSVTRSVLTVTGTVPGTPLPDPTLPEPERSPR